MRGYGKVTSMRSKPIIKAHSGEQLDTVGLIFFKELSRSNPSDSATSTLRKAVMTVDIFSFGPKALTK